MSRPRIISSANLLQHHIDDFIVMCDEKDKMPSDYELMKYLKVSKSTLNKYMDGKGKYEGYNKAFDNLVAYREHRLLEQLENNPKNNTAAIFQLKQKKNGGYTDSPIDVGGGGTTVTVKVEGVGGVEAFK